ncbi:hypothetical protein SARC_09639 [Sphaeroforma arctica JP610]|uniref:Uncharacterized protein n=1 Tax=Sphaeroforma arctica JP610 TaxID=667725 RepID=A0A0L0FMD3_9EUKA|nr:hypothetical protein SARC_09639 [Sphaeroforma arctica JP610]KNC77915.1 hypothetical protein SARC_09639 [Sphaeroforma arctica JP610]|eukprot:XP_014151817.1 hypothetical protein SARC_09639 [Sphaeroforma arctica JP610]
MEDCRLRSNRTHTPEMPLYSQGCTGYYGGAPIYLDTVSDSLSIKGTYLNNTNYFNHSQGGAIFIGTVGAKRAQIQGLFRGSSAREDGAIVINKITGGDLMRITGVFHTNAAEDIYGYCGSHGGGITVRKVENASTLIINGTFGIALGRFLISEGTFLVSDGMALISESMF